MCVMVALVVNDFNASYDNNYQISSMLYSECKGQHFVPRYGRLVAFA